MNQWINVDDAKDVKKGDFVRGVVMTWSQKWLSMPDYQDCNCTTYGFVTSDDHEDFSDIIVERVCAEMPYRFIIDNDINELVLVQDVGQSGMITVKKYVGNDVEQEIINIKKSCQQE